MEKLGTLNKSIENGSVALLGWPRNLVEASCQKDLTG